MKRISEKRITGEIIRINDDYFVDLPKIAIIGKEGFCSEKENLTQKLWAEANAHFAEVADVGMKNADG